MTDPSILLDTVLLVFLIFIAAVVLNVRNLMSAVMLTGIFSLLSAGLFVAMDAVDVAFTEASVGAGISTVLMLAALSMTSEEEKERRRVPWMARIVVILTGLVLIYGTFDMPAWGDPNAPIHQHVADHYILESGHEIGIPNIVTSVLADYRGYDTLGETFVVLTAGIGVMLLIGGRKRKAAEDEP